MHTRQGKASSISVPSEIKSECTILYFVILYYSLFTSLFSSLLSVSFLFYIHLHMVMKGGRKEGIE
jgi:hypothetical protein